jgi:transcriptional regulator with XRE-family HTH domain
MMMVADLASSQGIGPLTEMMALSRQENMTNEQFIELAGRSAAELGVDPSEIVGGWLRARRDHISGVFEFPSEDGVAPQDRIKAADVLGKMLEAVARYPFLQQTFDPIEIFKEEIRQLGLHNLGDFLAKPPMYQAQIAPMDQVQQMAARGQAQPIGRPPTGAREAAQGLTLGGMENGAGIPRTG